MNSKKSLVITLVILIIVIAGAAFLYNRFADGITPGLAPIDDGTNTDKSEITVTDDKAELPEEQITEEIPLAPDFTVEDTDGNKYKLSDFRGKPVIVNFWASWCGPCKMEMPDFEELYKQYGEEINFLMVNMKNSSRACSIVS